MGYNFKAIKLGENDMLILGYARVQTKKSVDR